MVGVFGMESGDLLEGKTRERCQAHWGGNDLFRRAFFWAEVLKLNYSMIQDVLGFSAMKHLIGVCVNALEMFKFKHIFLEKNPLVKNTKHSLEINLLSQIIQSSFPGFITARKSPFSSSQYFMSCAQKYFRGKNG